MIMRLPSDRPPATAPVAPATQGSSLTWHTSQEVANVSYCTCTRCWLHRIERGSMVGTGQMCESMVGTTKAQIRRATHDRGKRQQWPSRTLRLSDRSPTEAASQMARVWKRRSAAAGRSREVTNGCFVAAKLTEDPRASAAASGKSGCPVRVGSSSSQD